MQRCVHVIEKPRTSLLFGRARITKENHREKEHDKSDRQVLGFGGCVLAGSALAVSPRYQSSTTMSESHLNHGLDFAIHAPDQTDLSGTYLRK